MFKNPNSGSTVPQYLPPSISPLPHSQKFFTLPEAFLDLETAKKLLHTLQRQVEPHLIPLSQTIDPKLTLHQRLNYSEIFKKVMRVKTLRLDNPKSKSIWESCNIEALISPKLARQCCEKLFGRTFLPSFGRQVVCYSEGDYFGPHNDHHPELPHMRHGYVDFHYYVCTPEVDSQFIVYENKGHLNKLVSLAQPVGLNIYQLPFWHYTTPLQVRSDSTGKGRRWIVMYTFYFSDPRPLRPNLPNQKRPPSKHNTAKYSRSKKGKQQL